MHWCCPPSQEPSLTARTEALLPALSSPPAEELPIRLAHRVKELDELPNGLNKMPSIVRVKDWYAQSFEVREDPP